MNVTFFIGNGFDINLGLSTSYSDFYKYCLSPEEQSTNKIQRKIFDSIEKDIEGDGILWSDFEKGLGNFLGELEVNDIPLFQEALINIKDILSEYLKTETTKLKLISDQKELTQIVTNSIDNISKEFCPKDQQTIQKVFNTHKAESIKYNFLTFNYTDSLEQVIDQAFKGEKTIGSHRYSSDNYSHSIGQIIHMHGTFDNRMILGVNDISQIKNEKLQNSELLIHTFIKPIINDDCGQLINETAEQFINNSNILVVFGMSIGETDKKWWETICNKMVNDGSCILLIFDLNKNCSRLHMENDFFYKKQLKDRLLKNANLPSKQQENVRNRILIKFNSNKMFKVKIADFNEHKELVGIT